MPLLLTQVVQDGEVELALVMEPCNRSAMPCADWILNVSAECRNGRQLQAPVQLHVSSGSCSACCKEPSLLPLLCEVAIVWNGLKDMVLHLQLHEHDHVLFRQAYRNWDVMWRAEGLLNFSRAAS